MTADLKEILAIIGSSLTIIVTVAGCTAAIISRTVVITNKMATKEDLQNLDKKLSDKLDKLTEIKADKQDVNQRLISVESFLRIPRPLAIAAEAEKEATR